MACGLQLRCEVSVYHVSWLLKRSRCSKVIAYWLPYRITSGLMEEESWLDVAGIPSVWGRIIGQARCWSSVGEHSKWIDCSVETLSYWIYGYGLRNFLLWEANGIRFTILIQSKSWRPICDGKKLLFKRGSEHTIRMITALSFVCRRWDEAHQKKYHLVWLYFV